SILFNTHIISFGNIGSAFPKAVNPFLVWPTINSIDYYIFRGGQSTSLLIRNTTLVKWLISCYKNYLQIVSIRRPVQLIAGCLYYLTAKFTASISCQFKEIFGNLIKIIC